MYSVVFLFAHEFAHEIILFDMKRLNEQLAHSGWVYDKLHNILPMFRTSIKAH